MRTKINRMYRISNLPGTLMIGSAQTVYDLCFLMTSRHFAPPLDISKKVHYFYSTSQQTTIRYTNIAVFQNRISSGIFAPKSFPTIETRAYEAQTIHAYFCCSRSHEVVAMKWCGHMVY